MKRSLAVAGAAVLLLAGCGTSGSSEPEAAGGGGSASGCQSGVVSWAAFVVRRVAALPSAFIE